MRDATVIEATIRDVSTGTVDDNRRRKWDCFHLATAVTTECRTIYVLDDKFVTRKTQLALTLDVQDPAPVKPLFGEIQWGGPGQSP